MSLEYAWKVRQRTTYSRDGFFRISTPPLDGGFKADFALGGTMSLIALLLFANFGVFSSEYRSGLGNPRYFPSTLMSRA